MIGKFCLECGAESQKTGQVKTDLPKEESRGQETKSVSNKINVKAIS
ncbi:MAG: hypothetical protein RBS85_04205 [Methanofastidiosum sp.]|jgi:hypothetical protein|nr:hypothetical protein [Methanofastidiosum sp.]